MQKLKNFNQVPEELIEECVPTLESGQVVTFQMLTGMPNNDPDPAERQRNPMLYGKVQIPTRDKIKYKGKLYDIGVPTEIDSQENPIGFRAFLPGIGNSIFLGKFSLSADRVEDVELYEFLMITNYNESFKYRDKSVKPLFKVIDAAKDSRNVLNKIDVLKEAIDVVKNASEEDLIEFGRSVNWPEIKEPLQLKAKVSEFAKNDAETFLKLFKDTSKKLKAMVKEAIDCGVVDVDFSTGDVSMAKNVITSISDFENPVDAISKFLSTTPNGQNLQSTMKKLTKEAKKAVLA